MKLKFTFNKNTKEIANRKLTKLLLLSLLTLCLTGCGKNKALEAYKADIESFAFNITELNDNINNIDMTSETRITDFLTYMDALDAEFSRFAALEVPKQFSSVESLADDAGMYMTEAVSLYHQAFATQPFDSTLLDAANENYKRANTRIDYIATILQGELPEGDNITITSMD